MATTTNLDPEPLRSRCRGGVTVPGDGGWDLARQPWNVAVDQHPRAVVHAADADDIAAVVDVARGAGLRVAVQGTGHGAEHIESLEEAILIRTSAMAEVDIDPAARRARVGAGALWEDVTAPASAHGLAPLAGSSPDVGVVGYTLGGGMGWLARRHGLAANSVTAIELVTANGSRVRADRDHEPDLFWALRGGGGGVGVVTALEFGLYPVDTVYAGALMWPWERARDVLGRWAELTPSMPEELSTWVKLLQFPPIPEVPEPLRGGSFVGVQLAYLGEEADASKLLAPLRELGPALDTAASMPPSGLIRVAGDPEGPTPGITDQATLDELPPAAVEAFVETAGPGSGSPLVVAELRHLGGAVGRAAPDGGALSRLDAEFAFHAVGIPMAPEMAAAIPEHTARIREALAPWGSGRSLLNFAGRPTDPSTAFPPDTCARLRAIRAQADPDGLFLAAHDVPRVG
jgi:FAD/FMN-containing dehydrogenase